MAVPSPREDGPRRRDAQTMARPPETPDAQDGADLGGMTELPLLVRREDRLHAGRRGDHETLHLGKQASDPIPHIRVGQLPAARDDLCHEGFEYRVRASADLDSDRLEDRDLRAR